MCINLISPRYLPTACRIAERHILCRLSYFSQWLRELELRFVMRIGGLLEQSIEASYDSAVTYWLSSQTSLGWWSEAKSGFNHDFVTYVDKIIGV